MNFVTVLKLKEFEKFRTSTKISALKTYLNLWYFMLHLCTH